MRGNNTYSSQSVICAIMLTLCIILRALSIIFQWGSAANYVFYIGVIITIILVARRSFKNSDYNNACDFKSELKTYALFASFGFMIDFLNCLIPACKGADSDNINNAQIFALISASVFALLSSLYFIAISLSCGKTAYDFKKLRVLHLAPLFWAFSQSVYMITNAPSLGGDVYLILKSAGLIFAVLFFYYFIIEIENEEGAKKQTVFFSKAFSYFALLIFFSKCFELISKTAPLNNSETFFALSIFLIGLFAHFYRRQITQD